MADKYFKNRNRSLWLVLYPVKNVNINRCRYHKILVNGKCNTLVMPVIQCVTIKGITLSCDVHFVCPIRTNSYKKYKFMCY